MFLSQNYDDHFKERTKHQIKNNKKKNVIPEK